MFYMVCPLNYTARAYTRIRTKASCLQGSRTNHYTMQAYLLFCQSLWSDLNTQPSDYETDALPLCYIGIQYCPRESNPVSSDISRFPKTVEDKQHIDNPENTGSRNTLQSPYELDSFPRIFRYVSAMRAFLKEAVPYILRTTRLTFQPYKSCTGSHNAYFFNQTASPCEFHSSVLHCCYGVNAFSF